MVTILLSSFSLGSFFLGFNFGYKKGIYDVVTFFELQTGIKVTVTDLGNGIYNFNLVLPNGMILFNGVCSLHLLIQQIRNGKLISSSYHPMTITTFGKNWMADNIARSSGSYNQSKYAEYLASSNDSSSVSTSWTYIPNEITDGGLGRAQGTYTDTGTGTWNMSKTFSITATRSTKLYGYYIDSYANWAYGGLVAAEQQGTSQQKNWNSGDTMIYTIMGAQS